MTTSEKKFSLLRKLLRALGLSPEAVDDIVDRIVDLLAGNNETEQTLKFPYHIRDNFLSPAELSFFRVLHTTLEGNVQLCSKVGLGDLFWVKTDDQSEFRRFTNKIDRKHVDFLLCDPATMHPLIGIELDDKSHRRADRRARDEFVDQVFQAAGLPLLHIPVKRTYSTHDLHDLISPYLNLPIISPTTPQPDEPAPSQPPQCPQCGKPMVLRTAKKGTNAGNSFWGCPNYPTCRGVLPFQE